MKQVLLLLSAAGTLLACSNQTEQASAKNEAIVKSATAATEAAPDSATMMKNWQEYMTPGKEHELMASWNGKWSTEVTMWMAPGAPPSKSSGVTVNKTILGGRYQQSEHKSVFEGMPFEGISTLAFDKAKKKFISTWIDNMGTGVMMGEGPWDEATKTITIVGKMMDPSLQKEVDYRQTMRVVDNNSQVSEMFAKGADGKEFKTLELTYKRMQ
jgi:hypothetical protein